MTSCTERVVLEPGPESEASDASSTGEAPDPTSTEPTSTDPTPEASTTASTSTTDGSTGTTADTTTTGHDPTTGDPDDPSTGGAATCGPPCANTWTHQGDLQILEGQSTDEFVCMVAVTGVLSIDGNLDVAALAGLRNLQSVDELLINFNHVLTDLSPFACLEQANRSLLLRTTPKLVDVSALAGLRSAGYLWLEDTGLTALPAFHPSFTGVHTLIVRKNPALQGLGGAAGWGHLAGDPLTLQIDDNPALTSLVGLEGPLAVDIDVAVQVIGNPKLKSLAGLEAMTRGSLWLQDLPLVTDLLPLSNLTAGGGITLLAMPGLADLKGLHNLLTTNNLMIGDCVSPGPSAAGGLDGIVDLKGLDSLTQVSALWIARNAGLSALTGAPKLTTVGGLEVIDNPKLTQADVDALIAQLDATPDACFGDFNQCTCFEILPW